MQNKSQSLRLAQNRPTIGLALSGGGARGLAHIGVLKVLEREGIPVDYLAGTSMGAVIATGYAAGMNPYILEREAITATRKRQLLRLVDPCLLSGGLLRGQKVLGFFNREFGSKHFSDLVLPLAIIAVDVETHQEIVFREGPVATALRASVSLPGLFTPATVNGRRMVDGGVLNNLPVDVVRKMGADIVIGVDISLSHTDGIGQWIGDHSWVPQGLTATLKVIDDTIFTMRLAEQDQKMRLYPPDVLICPILPTHINSIAGYGRVAESILAGEQATETRLSNIKYLIQSQCNVPVTSNVNDLIIKMM